MGYHIAPITKGQVGEFSKIVEEVQELEDALKQDVKILALVEMSDLYGALEEFALMHYGMTMDDLRAMSDVTKRAFRDGTRK